MPLRRRFPIRRRQRGRRLIWNGRGLPARPEKSQKICPTLGMTSHAARFSWVDLNFEVQSSNSLELPQAAELHRGERGCFLGRRRSHRIGEEL